MSMGKNRCRTEIIASIISVARDGKCETEIKEKAHLNYRQLRRYLDELNRRGWFELKHMNGRTVRIASQDGKQFLEQYITLKKFLE